VLGVLFLGLAASGHCRFSLQSSSRPVHGGGQEGSCEPDVTVPAGPRPAVSGRLSWQFRVPDTACLHQAQVAGPSWRPTSWLPSPPILAIDGDRHDSHRRGHLIVRRRHIRRTTLAVTMLTVATAGVLPGSSGGRSATVEQRSVAVAAQPQTTLAPGESVVVRRHLGALARYLASREWAGPGASAAGRAAASTRDLALGQVFGARASRAHDRVALSGGPAGGGSPAARPQRSVRQPVRVSRLAVGTGVGLVGDGDQPGLRGLRHPTGVAGEQDGIHRARLAHESVDAGPLGAAIHRGGLWLPVSCLAAL